MMRSASSIVLGHAISVGRSENHANLHNDRWLVWHLMCVLEMPRCQQGTLRMCLVWLSRANRLQICIASIVRLEDDDKVPRWFQSSEVHPKYSDSTSDSIQS